jgi:Predicted metal-binding integral membrane protein (DUF2182)
VTYTDRERPLDRNALLCISGVGWGALLLGPGASSHCLAMVAGSMQLPESLHMLESMNSLASLVTGWFLMLAAMMAPVLILPIHHVRVQSFRRRRLRSITLFIVGYLGIWLIGGAVLLGMALLTQSFVWPFYLSVASVLTALVLAVFPDQAALSQSRPRASSPACVWSCGRLRCARLRGKPWHLVRRVLLGANDLSNAATSGKHCRHGRRIFPYL